MKKVLACLLILSLLPFGALSEGWFSSLFSGSGPKLRFVSVGNRAFSSDSARVIAATGDGRNVLISWAYELYLWDTRENRRIPLWFSQPEDVEMLNFTADNAALLAGKPGKDQREEKQKQIEQVKQRYLEQHGLEAFTSFDDVYGCYPRLVPLGVRLLDVGNEYALIVPNYFTASLLTDLRTGESRFVRNTHPALCGDRLYTGEEILRLDTGESYAPDYAAVQHENGSGWIKTIKLLKDDSLLYLTPSSAMNEKSERTMYLADVNAQGANLFELGTYKISQEPSELLVTGNGKYAAAYCPGGYTAGQAAILNRETGEVKSVGADSLMMVSATQDAFLCYDLSAYEIVKLDPETLEQSAVRITGLGLGDTVTYAAVSSVVTNGEGLYFVQNEILRGYFMLEQ